MDETIDICIDSLYNNNKNPPKIPEDDICNFFNVATKNSFFMFNRKLYRQIDGVAMGSLSGPALTNIFMRTF